MSGKPGKRVRRMWVVIWPDSDKVLSQNPGIPCAFFSRADARRWKRNSYLKTPVIRPVELLARTRKGLKGETK